MNEKFAQVLRKFYRKICFDCLYTGNQKLEIWKRTDGTIVGRTLDDGQSSSDQNEFDGTVSQQEVNHQISFKYPHVIFSIAYPLVYFELYNITR